MRDPDDDVVAVSAPPVATNRLTLLSREVPHDAVAASAPALATSRVKSLFREAQKARPRASSSLIHLSVLLRRGASGTKSDDGEE